MATVKVYRYDYYDALLKRERRSVDYATADAIAAQHGTILAESMREVDDAALSEAGTLRAMDVMKAEVPAGEPRPSRTRPRETRLGPG